MPTLLTLYTTMLKFPDHEGLDVRDFVRIELKRFHTALQETDRVGTVAWDPT